MSLKHDAIMAFFILNALIFGDFVSPSYLAYQFSRVVVVEAGLGSGFGLRLGIFLPDPD